MVATVADIVVSLVPSCISKKAAAASWKRSLEFLRATAVPCRRRALGPKSGTA